MTCLNSYILIILRALKLTKVKRKNIQGRRGSRTYESSLYLGVCNLYDVELKGRTLNRISTLKKISMLV